MWGNPHHNSEALPCHNAAHTPGLTQFLATVSNTETLASMSGRSRAFQQFWRYINLAANGLCTRRLEGYTKTAAPNSKTCRLCCAETNRKRRVARALASELAPNRRRNEPEKERGRATVIARLKEPSFKVFRELDREETELSRSRGTRASSRHHAFEGAGSTSKCFGSLTARRRS